MDVLKGSCEWPEPSEKRLDSLGPVREKVSSGKRSRKTTLAAREAVPEAGGGRSW